MIEAEAHNAPEAHESATVTVCPEQHTTKVAACGKPLSDCMLLIVDAVQKPSMPQVATEGSVFPQMPTL